MTDFTLHPQLAKDTVFVTKLTLCRVLLMTDATYPWLVLVPELGDIRELHQLEGEDQQVLMQEITFVAAKLEALVGADKMNVAALGNMVPQLHIHVIARFESDPAWPGPVWGAVPARAYTEEALEAQVEKLRSCLT
ncbi:HIT domain-containing protein [Kordiimonas lacus]|uniref:Diadenosine tetraphosphate (Ap4A) hydrolase n=1 Tax=Kordiimonas lacus TaxID=637679 RepID=A0A1G6T866_9PROT|nr:HIT family protein [Kordiimonas lacus]SDD25064.1 Diadenosine tetraphosphate (Ap4A) hydrolase [Kordiimonas lacus]